jgi:hypothetical protein
MSFSESTSLEFVIFESGSRLEQIEESAGARTGLKSIEIPSYVIVLGKESFAGCTSLESAVPVNRFRFERTEESGSVMPVKSKK